MKKFIFIFIILIILSGVVFYFGWIQIHIPANSCAVIHTKTSGYDKNVIMSGEFSWRVEKLIPTNMTMYIFNTDPVIISLPEITGSLPSADIYSTVIPGNPDFDYKMDLTITYSFNIETLPVLVSEKGLLPDNIEEWYSEKSDFISQYVIDYVQKNPVLFYDAEYMEELRNSIQILPEISNIIIDSIYFNNVNFPDLELYNAAKEIYFNLLEARENKDIDAINEEKNNLLVLEEYGELLTRYPILIKYLYLNELSEEDAIRNILESDLNEILNLGE
jgi:hypothetical protein